MSANPAEADRLRALEEYQILDTAPEPNFDGITTLLASMLDAPIAAISLVDRERIWLKSHYGLDISELPCQGAFCARVVAERAPLIVPDALEDSIFRGSMLVRDGGIRFYAGVPLRTPQGHVLGTLCALDTKARDLNPKQKECLALLGRQVVALLDLRKKERTLAREHEALLASESRLRTLFDSMAEGVMNLDGEARITAFNEAAVRILGWPAEAMRNRRLPDLVVNVVDEDGKPMRVEDLPGMRALRTGEVVSDVTVGITSPTRGPIWLVVHARPILSSPGMPALGVVATFHDVTEKKSSARRLAAHERLATTGTLAAGIGHEINNPLSFLTANLDFALEELRILDGTSRVREVISVLGEAKEGAERIRKIVRGLRALAREEGALAPTPVSSVVDLAVSLALHEIKHRATITLDLQDGVLAMADENRLIQVLVNLLVNAAQAFVESDPSRNQIEVRSRREGESVDISVIDNGPGIAPEVLPRIYDPFFTTKPVGVGTGLGLAVSHAVVLALKGELLCDTGPAGTTFRVRLPSAQQHPSSIPGPVPSGIRVWVIDDEPAILRSVSRILQDEFEVLKIWDARDALDRIRAGERADAVLCDVMMPYLSGMDLYAEAVRIDPLFAERFVFITGGLAHAQVARFLADVKNERLEKPFSMQGLRGVIRRVVEQPRG